MNNPIDLHFSALLLAVVTTTIGQISLKTGAREKKRISNSFFNFFTFLGYGLLFTSTVMVVFAMQKVEMKTVSIWGALPYVLVTVLASSLLKEKLSKRKVTGSLLIVAGVVVFNSDSIGFGSF